MKKLLRKQSSAVMCVEGAPFLASDSPLTDKNFTCHGQSLSGWNDVHLDLRISLQQAQIKKKKKKKKEKKKTNGEKRKRVKLRRRIAEQLALDCSESSL